MYFTWLSDGLDHEMPYTGWYPGYNGIAEPRNAYGASCVVLQRKFNDTDESMFYMAVSGCSWERPFLCKINSGMFNIRSMFYQF